MQLRVHEQVHPVEGQSFPDGTLLVELGFLGHFRQAVHHGELLHECPAVAPRGLLHVGRHGRQEAVQFAEGDLPAIFEGRHHSTCRSGGECLADVESCSHGVRRWSWWRGRRGRRGRHGRLCPHGGCKQEEQE